MNCLLLIITLAFSTPGAGDEPKYPVSAIPAELKEGANAVVREDAMTCKVLSTDKVIVNVRMAVTVMNAKGKYYAKRSLGYDKHRKINSLRAIVYDANGEVIKKLKNNEIVDQSSYDGFSLYSDNRLKHFDLTQGNYPYTIEYEYEMEYKTALFIPGSFLYSGENVSVEKWTYQLAFKNDVTPRYKLHNIDRQPKKETNSDGLTSLTWEFENVKPIKTEPHGPPMEELLPYIEVAPSKFEFDGYKGDMSTWRDYGKWQILLNQGRDALPEETKSKIRAIVKEMDNDEAKIKALYEYLQSKTRYVSIQLGIGGMQPFEASVVDKTGYGDCKALSNYMVSMLKEVGIKGYYSYVEGSTSPTSIDPNFPSDPFNHIIVAVPLKQDTVWLECTSQTNPYGYLGEFTGDRQALMITEDGGKLVNTTRYKTENNTQIRNAEVIVDGEGNATAKVHTTYGGLQYENGGLDFVLNYQYEYQKKWVMEMTKIPSFDVNSFTMSNQKNKIPSATVLLDLNLRRYASVNGKRMFITPNLMNRFTGLPEKVENRKTDVWMPEGYIDIDTIKYTLPENIYPEFLPEPVKLKSRFGEYESHVVVEQGSVLYVRKLRMNKGRFAPETYAEYMDFYKGINKADNMKLVFVNKT